MIYTAMQKGAATAFFSGGASAMMRRHEARARPGPPDLAALAKRFIDLWQEQMTALAGDPALAESIGRFMRALPPGMPFWPGPHDPAPGRAANRPPASAAPPDERRRGLDQLASRLDAIEKRLARLETGCWPPRRRKLQASLKSVKPEAFAAALDAEIVARADAMLRGIERYRHHPYRRPDDETPVLWQQGATRILDYGPADGAPLLVVPSLINKAYVLDLLPETA